MDSYSKLKLTSEDTEDRISVLPDRVLSHILSFLPTKYAVLTSVLSSRWRYLWTSIHNLNFDSYDILNEKNRYNDHEEIFISFISRVMNSCTSENIYKFRLVCSQRVKIPVSHLHDWIRTVADRNVEKLKIQVYNNQGLQLPDNLFTCKSLVSLKLRLDWAFGVPALPNCFPSLKFLRISLTHPSPQLTEELFTKCSVLESLSINCSFGDEVNRTFNISAPELKTLELDIATSEEAPEYKLFINAPLLEYLCLTDKNMACCIKEPLPSIGEVVLDVGNHEYLQMGYDYERSQLLHAHNLLGAVANSENLSLCLQTTMALHHGCHDGEIPCFPNVTTLKLELYEFMVVKMLPKFLQRCPKLKVLVLEMEQHDEDEDNYKRRFKWMYSDLVSAFFLHRLRVVRILSFSGRPVEWNVAEYFLGKAEMLRKMIVRSTQRKKAQKAKILDRLSKFPKASETCIVKVV